jgi:hypothetical protein
MQKPKTMKNIILLTIIAALLAGSCKPKQKEETTPKIDHEALAAQYAEVTLEADISHLSENEKEVLKIMFQISDIMDELFWIQAYGDKAQLVEKIDNEFALKFAMIQYGPWNRLDNLSPFIEGYGEKPMGANFYPADMTKEEFEAWDNPDKTSLYTMIRRDENGKLQAIWYKDYFADKMGNVINLMRQAAELAEDAGLKNYLMKRAKAFETDDYLESDMAWMDMKTSNIDFVVGPIENYEDKLFGYKAAYEAFILIKDLEWSAKLEKYAAMLPSLQKGLPVDPAYKAEMPGADSDMNVYQAVYYAGDCNAGSKSIAINLPNDERVHIAKGSRKLQLKNSMKAKFDKILVPISEILIAEEQRKHIKFDAFFENVMFHEVAHGMGIKNVIGDTISVRKALMEAYSPVEEAKADIMGLYLVYKLYEMGELSSGEVMDNFVTFVAGIFRSTRFGAASSHGKANMMRFNYFINSGAIERRDDGTYFVHFDKMTEAMISSVQQILKIQGDGAYDEAVKLIENEGIVTEQLQKDLDRINEAKIPVDIVFKQGLSNLGL